MEFDSFLLPFVLYGLHTLFTLFVFNNLFIYRNQMMPMSYNSNVTGSTGGARTAYHSGAHELNSGFSGVCVTQFQFSMYLFINYYFSSCSF